MSAATVVIGAYGLVAVVAAIALHALGCRAGVAGGRRNEPPGDVTGTGHSDPWPHSEVPALHTGVGAVAAFGAGVLPTVQAFMASNAVESAALAAVGAAGFLTLAWLGRSMWIQRRRVEGAGAG